MLKYRNDRLNKNMLSLVLRFVQSRNVFPNIHKNLRILDDRVDCLLGTFEFCGLWRWAILKSHTIIQKLKNTYIKISNSYKIIRIGFVWKCNNLMHREKDKYAFVGVEKTLSKLDYIQIWYRFGSVHRDKDNPSFIIKGMNNNDVWFHWTKFGQTHRENDNPAIICKDCLKWTKRGKLHRNGAKPAVIWSNGNQEWYKNHKKLMSFNPEEFKIFQKHFKPRSKY